MRTTKTITGVIAAATTLSLVGLGAGAAQAASSGSTTATFSITGGALDITVPANGVVLGSAVATGATTAGGSLGAVSIADTRGALNSSWTTTVTSTAFQTGTATADETVATSAIDYTSGLVSGTGGGLSVVRTGSGLAGAGIAAAIGSGTTAAKLTLGVGNNTATWTPSVTFNLLATQVAGTYSGTITHSAA